MIGKELFALQDGDEIIYIVCIFCGHVFRKYLDERIEASDDQEREIAKKC